MCDDIKGFVSQLHFLKAFVCRKALDDIASLYHKKLLVDDLKRLEILILENVWCHILSLIWLENSFIENK